ncbi:hypothetical protein MBAV_000328 [Candidatus Magnetobacterium bavaricum]|uniref:Uncharacterized protein n=1 Tax=Candidatus Magnetobacterium bavaricum TaxID=29290 RepID=A0A0F3H051_9BACT|nr:hypothetical protein MBAV_000328 [Candidatus Magnetobacterium bavaricum]
MPALRHTLLYGFRRYKFDALIVVVIVSLMPFVVARYGKMPITEGKVATTDSTRTAQDKDPLMAFLQHQDMPYEHLLERNIFSPDGKYAPDVAAPAAPVAPAKTYRLVGVLNTSVVRAVLMDNTDTLYILKEKDKLGDGNELSAIKRLSVVLKDDNGEKELTVFDVKR